MRALRRWGSVVGLLFWRPLQWALTSLVWACAAPLEELMGFFKGRRGGGIQDVAVAAPEVTTEGNRLDALGDAERNAADVRGRQLPTMSRQGDARTTLTKSSQLIVQ